MSRRRSTVNPFLPQRQSPLWLRIVQALFKLVAAIVVFPIALAIVLLVIMLLPVFVLCSIIRDRVFGVDLDDEPDDTGPPSYWPSCEHTITSEQFGELNIARNGQAWQKATFPAFARFGSRYREFADWVNPDLPPPGEIAVMLGDDELSTERDHFSTYRRMLDLLERHQESIADEIQRKVRTAAWLKEHEMGDVDDRFRVSSTVLLRLTVPVVMLELDQTWDIEHAWTVEIAGLTDDGFESLELGPM